MIHNTCNMSTRDLPDMFALSPQAYISGKSFVPMLQLLHVQENVVPIATYHLINFRRDRGFPSHFEAPYHLPPSIPIQMLVALGIRQWKTTYLKWQTIQYLFNRWSIDDSKQPEVTCKHLFPFLRYDSYLKLYSYIVFLNIYNCMWKLAFLTYILLTSYTQPI